MAEGIFSYVLRLKMNSAKKTLPWFLTPSCLGGGEGGKYGKDYSKGMGETINLMSNNSRKIRVVK